MQALTAAPLLLLLRLLLQLAKQDQLQPCWLLLLLQSSIPAVLQPWAAPAALTA
jgi:hypothetical protein